MVLHFAPQTCARVTLVALEETGAPFATRLVRFMAGDHRSPAFLACNPAGKVPVLEIGGQSLTQNSAILPYLARTFPAARLLPFTGDALADAQVQARLAWFAADLHPLVTRIRMPQFFCDLDGAPARVRELAMQAMAFQLRSVEQDLGQQPWLAGEEWSILDAYLSWVWFRIAGAGFDTAAYPNLGAHHERADARPAALRALAREAEAQAELERAGQTVPLN
ncbi:glutathione S-transferase family protein [Aurantiacibacter arachoides]|nr:glutathione S-transferase family protein [Aurantiacibacter arachoides]GGD46228.1 glutathione S-transferase [Aurantiacibacter arachoides]